MTPVVRFALVRRDGSEFVRGDVLAIITRSGSDEEALDVLFESLEDGSPVNVWDFDLLELGTQPQVHPVATIITARERDPELWEAIS